jgi:hypothetical protein
MVLVAQFGATGVGGTRQESTTRRGRFIGVEALNCTSIASRTYSASNFGSITPLANQIRPGQGQKASSTSRQNLQTLQNVRADDPIRVTLEINQVADADQGLACAGVERSFEFA